jgi:Domain of unknown function (DUF6265)
MKKIAGLIILFSCFISCAQTSGKILLVDFEWLLGKWELINNKPGQITYERWTKESDIKYVGYGWTMKGKDTVFVEKLNLIIKDNHVYYVADIKENSSPVLFKIIEQSKKAFISSNPAHDFPKKIEYKAGEENNMTAVISGDGKEISYNFKKIQ